VLRLTRGHRLALTALLVFGVAGSTVGCASVVENLIPAEVKQQQQEATENLQGALMEIIPAATEVKVSMELDGLSLLTTADVTLAQPTLSDDEFRSVIRELYYVAEAAGDAADFANLQMHATFESEAVDLGAQALAFGLPEKVVTEDGQLKANARDLLDLGAEAFESQE